MGNPIGTGGVDAGHDLATQTCDADHVELVEVGAEDRQELQPLQQAIPRVERLVQYSGVELEPAQLTIDVK